MSEKKKGFFESLAEMADQSIVEDTDGIKLAKGYLEKLDLTAEEKGWLGGWLIGEGVKDSIISAFSDKPPE